MIGELGGCLGEELGFRAGGATFGSGWDQENSPTTEGVARGWLSVSNFLLRSAGLPHTPRANSIGSERGGASLTRTGSQAGKHDMGAGR